ncbi:MAG: hypothetical protein ACRD5K_15310 [Candidatus Acidiferrales bacterium]
MAASAAQQALIDAVNNRIDKCVKDNSTYERILWAALALMLLVGLSILGYGVFHLDRLVISVSVGETGITIWPIRSLIKLHRGKMALEVIPAITSVLSPRDAAREIHALIQHLLDNR